MEIEKLVTSIAGSNPNYKTSSEKDKFELSKLFVKKHLCSSCRQRLIDKNTNDFLGLKFNLCPRCEIGILNSFDRIANRRVPQRILEINREIRQRLIYEIESKTGEKAYYFLKALHKDRNLTAPAIKEYLFQKYQISIGGRHLTLIMRNWGILDTHIEALRKRVYTGRMDYKRRKIDYKSRDIDYKKREQRKREGFPPENVFLHVTASKPLKKNIKALSRKHKKTMSQVVRLLLDSVEGLNLPRNCTTYARKIQYAIKNRKQYLTKDNFEKVHGVKIIITTDGR